VRGSVSGNKPLTPRDSVAEQMEEEDDQGETQVCLKREC